MAFEESIRFSKGIDVLNSTEGSKLPKLASRVAQSIGTDNKTPFTDDEKYKLSEVLEINTDSVNHMLEAIKHIYERAAYHSWKPAILSEQLSSLGMDEERSGMLSQGWQKYGRDIVSRLKKKTLTANQLDRVDWHLNLQVAQGSKSKITEPNVVLQLNVNDPSEKGSHDVLMEFNHEELLAFYNKLETIQEQMDALS
ncbi:COMM domain-containing protein 10-like [Styela clava]